MWRLVFLIILFQQVSFSYRYAIVVGINSGGDNVDSLHFAENDANNFSNILARNITNNISRFNHLKFPNTIQNFFLKPSNKTIRTKLSLIRKFISRLFLTLFTHNHTRKNQVIKITSPSSQLSYL